MWQDKRPLHVLSTLSQPGDTAKVSRRQRDGSVAEVSCHSAILTYTKYMGGVDSGDQFRKYYAVRLKCNNVSTFFGLFLMYPLQTHLYLESYVRHSHIRVRQPTSAPTPFHSPHHHARQRCTYCRYYRDPPCRRESVWQCVLCEGSPTLCLTGKDDGSDCWALWHAEAQAEAEA